ncbi:MAG: permease [Thermodesulfobacteriota bacterium]|nr:permease [Thermodesulfobacteriota bacterium]
MSKNLLLVSITLIAIIVSAVINKQKTALGLRRGIKMFMALLPQFLVLLVLVSIFFAFVPQKTLASFLMQQAGWLGIIVTAIIGSIALIPAPIAYPLTGMLAQNGVPLSILAVFITTLMMVGILTLPVEKAYFGLPLTILRNFLFLVGALIIGLLVGVIL